METSREEGLGDGSLHATLLETDYHGCWSYETEKEQSVKYVSAFALRQSKFRAVSAETKRGNYSSARRLHTHLGMRAWFIT